MCQVYVIAQCNHVVVTPKISISTYVHLADIGPDMSSVCYRPVQPCSCHTTPDHLSMGIPALHNVSCLIRRGRGVIGEGFLDICWSDFLVICWSDLLGICWADLVDNCYICLIFVYQICSIFVHYICSMFVDQIYLVFVDQICSIVLDQICLISFDQICSIFTNQICSLFVDQIGGSIVINFVGQLSNPLYHLPAAFSSKSSISDRRKAPEDVKQIIMTW